MAVKEKLTDMERVSVQLTAEMKEQTYDWAREANVKPGYFMSVALSIGTRDLRRRLNPESAFSPGLWQQVLEGASRMTPEQLGVLGIEAEDPTSLRDLPNPDTT